jgi:hypothetical protein
LNTLKFSHNNVHVELRLYSYYCVTVREFFLRHPVVSYYSVGQKKCPC